MGGQQQHGIDLLVAAQATHLVAAAIVIPVVATRLGREQPVSTDGRGAFRVDGEA